MAADDLHGVGAAAALGGGVAHRGRAAREHAAAKTMSFDREPATETVLPNDEGHIRDPRSRMETIGHRRSHWHREVPKYPARRVRRDGNLGFRA